MYDTIIVQGTENYIRQNFEKEATGHDLFHALRVRNIAKDIMDKEGGDLYTIELGALLHDIADYKFHDGNEFIGPRKAKELLTSLKADKRTIRKVCEIISTISFKGGFANRPKTLEGRIVQDADRIDALGAIGIARAFAYGGHMGRPIHDPNIKARKYESEEDYKKSKTGTTITHFDEKLLLLKDTMNTKTGKELAERRHKFMRMFLAEFYGEWEGRL
jgi:uncharacterized protein